MKRNERGWLVGQGNDTWTIPHLFLQGFFMHVAEFGSKQQSG